MANVCEPLCWVGVHCQSAYITFLSVTCVNGLRPLVAWPFHVNAKVGALYSY